MNDCWHDRCNRSTVLPSANRYFRFSLTACRIVYVLAVALLSTIPCRADYGPIRDVKSARQAELAAWGPHRRRRCYEVSRQENKCGVGITDVTVVGPYALVDWATVESGGQSLLRRDGSHWGRIGHGGGVMVLPSLEIYGVPHSIAVRLVAHNASSNTAEGFVLVPTTMALPDCAGKPMVRPPNVILTCADAGVSVSGITWTGWGNSFAAGRGIASVNDCKPFCAAGHYKKYKIVLIADGSQRCPNGQKAYARITEAWIGPSPYPQRSSREVDPVVPYPCR